MKHYLTGQVSKLWILSEGIRTEHRAGDTEYRKGRTINNEKIKSFIETDELKKKVYKQDLGLSENDWPHVDLHRILTEYLEISLERLYGTKYTNVINEYEWKQICMSNLKQ